GVTKIPTVDELLRRKFSRKTAATFEMLAEKKPIHAWFFYRYARAKLIRDCVIELAEIKHRNGVLGTEDEKEVAKLIEDSHEDMETLESFILPHNSIPSQKLPTLQEFDEMLLLLIRMGVKPHRAVGSLLKQATAKRRRKEGRPPTKKHVALLALELLHSQRDLNWPEITNEVGDCGQSHKYNSKCVKNLQREVNHLKKFMRDYDRDHGLPPMKNLDLGRQ